MKIIHLIPRIVYSLGGVFVGGSVNALFNLIRGTNEYTESIIYTHTCNNVKKCSKELKLKFPNVDFRIERNIINPGSLLYGLYFLARGLWILTKQKAWGADIIHGHSGFIQYGILTVLLGKILRRPVVHSLYCPIVINKQYNFLNFIKLKLYYYILKYIDKIFVISKNIENSLLKIGIPHEKIKLISPVVDAIKFHPQNYSNNIRNKLEIYGEEPIILFVGNLKDSKGLDILVDALGYLINEKLFQFVFTLELHDKEFESRFKKIMMKIQENGLLKYTTQLGLISFMPTLLASVDLLVMPYRDTNGPSDYPIVLLEAMASGIPAVGTRVGGIPELIDDDITGLLVEPENIFELSNAIEKMLEDKTYRVKLGKNARKKYLKTFNDQMIKRMVKEVYEKLNKNERRTV